MEYRIISIGALSVHELWSQQGEARSPHATTTLIQAGGRNILVDPALPREALTARLSERAGLGTDSITDVFLTNFRPAHRMGITAFPNARWLISENEREMLGNQLVAQYQQEQDEENRATLQQEIALLKNCTPAPQQIVEGVDIFPSAGFTPGTCGLVLSFHQMTIVLAGDAVATDEHLKQGRVLRGAWDAEQAKESLKEVIEIADVIIPGHDNILLNPTKRYF
jgi:glyoxylase-like metal-dependent hydrolase (beta-lactamase superfamily II)